MFHGADGSAVVQLLVLAEPGAFRQMLAETLSIIGGLDVTAAGWNERPQGRHDAALASLVGQPGEALKAARGLAALPKPPAVVFFDRALDRVHLLAAREMGTRGYWTGQDRLEAMVAGRVAALKGTGPCFRATSRRRTRFRAEKWPVWGQVLGRRVIPPRRDILGRVRETCRTARSRTG